MLAMIKNFKNTLTVRKYSNTQDNEIVFLIAVSIHEVLEFWENVKYSFIAITSRFTLTWNSST